MCKQSLSPQIKADARFGGHPAALTPLEKLTHEYLIIARSFACSLHHRRPKNLIDTSPCKLVTTQINQIFINRLVNRNSSIMVKVMNVKSENEQKHFSKTVKC